MNLFSQLELDTWYKAFIVLGGSIVIISLLYISPVIPFIQMFFFGLGIFFIGCGEWKNHYWKLWEKHATIVEPYVQGRKRCRYNSLLGTLFDIIGIILIFIFAINFYSLYKDDVWVQ